MEPAENKIESPLFYPVPPTDLTSIPLEKTCHKVESAKRSLPAEPEESPKRKALWNEETEKVLRLLQKGEALLNDSPGQYIELVKGILSKGFLKLFDSFREFPEELWPQNVRLYDKWMKKCLPLITHLHLEIKGKALPTYCNYLPFCTGLKEISVNLVYASKDVETFINNLEESVDTLKKIFANLSPQASLKIKVILKKSDVNVSSQGDYFFEESGDNVFFAFFPFYDWAASFPQFNELAFNGELGFYDESGLVPDDLDALASRLKSRTASFKQKFVTEGSMRETLIFETRWIPKDSLASPLQFLSEVEETNSLSPERALEQFNNFMSRCLKEPVEGVTTKEIKCVCESEGKFKTCSFYVEKHKLDFNKDYGKWMTASSLLRFFQQASSPYGLLHVVSIDKLKPYFPYEG